MAIAAVDVKALGHEIKRLEQTSKNVSVVVLEKLKEFDDECGWHLFSCKSLFEFCTRELKLLECAAWFRTQAVRLLRTHPQVAAYLREGRMTMSTLVQLRKVLPKHEPAMVFGRCLGKSSRQVAKIVAELDPQKGRATTLRRYPEKKAAAATPRPSREASPEIAGAIPTETVAPAEPIAPAETTAPADPTALPPAPLLSIAASVAKESAPNAPPLLLVAPVRPLGLKVRPINARDYALNATVDQDFVDQLDRLKQLESHSVPTGDLVEIVRRAIQVAIEYRLKKKAAQTKNPRNGRHADSDAIPAAVKRAVWERDGGCCAWIHPDGSRCGSRWMIEFDHIRALAHGGLSTIETVRLLCRDHNQQHERDVFGIDFVKKKKGKR